MVINIGRHIATDSFESHHRLNCILKHSATRGFIKVIFNDAHMRYHGSVGKTGKLRKKTKTSCCLSIPQTYVLLQSMFIDNHELCTEDMESHSHNSVIIFFGDSVS